MANKYGHVFLGATIILAGAGCGTEPSETKRLGETSLALEGTQLQIPTDAEAASIEEAEMPVGLTLTAEIGSGEILSASTRDTVMAIQQDLAIGASKPSLPPVTLAPKVNPLLLVDEGARVVD